MRILIKDLLIDDIYSDRYLFTFTYFYISI